MRIYIFILFSIILSTSCQKNVQDESSEAIYLSHRLHKAEDLRFSHPMVVDTMLSSIYEELQENNSDEYWAKYYFLKAHVEMLKGNYNKVFQWLDSAGIYPMFVEEYQHKMDLLSAHVYEKMYLYEPSYEYFVNISEQTVSESFSPNDKLIALMGKARIEFWLSSDYRTTFRQVEAFIETHKDIDYAFFHSNAVLLDKHSRLNMHLNKSEQYAIRNKCYYQLMQNYIQHAAFCREQDSIDYYLDKAKQSKVEHQLESMYDNTFLEASYLEIKSKSAYSKGLISEAVDLGNRGVELSLKLKLEDKAYRMSMMLSDIQFKNEEYASAMALKDKAYKYRMAYSKRINADKMKYLSTKKQAEKLKQENDELLIEQRNKALQNRLILAYGLIVTFLIYILFANRRKINALLSTTTRKMRENELTLGKYKEQNKAIIQKSKNVLHRKEVLLKEKQSRLEEISSLVIDSPYKDKSKLTKIEDLVKSGQASDNWDVFLEKYQFRYPNGEQRIRLAFLELSTKDYQYLMCIHYGMSHDKIARMFSIQKDSVNKRSRRIKKALKIPSNIAIKSFLLSKIQDAEEE